MKGKYSSPLHKILPMVLCVLLFICTILPIIFADGYSSAAGGVTRGGGVGRLNEGLAADIAAAPQSGDLIYNSCGAAYSSKSKGQGWLSIVGVIAVIENRSKIKKRHRKRNQSMI